MIIYKSLTNSGAKPKSTGQPHARQQATRILRNQTTERMEIIENKTLEEMEGWLSRGAFMHLCSNYFRDFLPQK